jgi:hypothetical protein
MAIQVSAKSLAFGCRLWDKYGLRRPNERIALELLAR